MDTITRQDQYFDAMSGGSSEIPEPITRKEQYYAKMAGEDVEVPEPITREEFWLHKIIEHGGGGGTTTIEPLTVTENGSYSETGKAYSPVSVNVPNPSTGTLNITENGTYDVTEKASAVVNVGGGAFIPLFGAIRPDAELVKKWEYDELMVQDLELTIPEYNTSQLTILNEATQNLEQITLDFETYDYILMRRGLVYPIKSTTVHEKGAFEYSTYFGVMFPLKVVANECKSLDGTLTNSSAMIPTADSIIKRWAVYDNSASNIAAVDESQIAGVYMFSALGSINTNNVLSVKKASIMMKGNSIYFTSADWSRVTDIRAQYITELYRAPKGSDLSGWTLNMLHKRDIDCVISPTHTLT